MSFDFYYFTKPSFGRGFARAIDIPGILSRKAVILSASTAEADRRAIRSDWQVVGTDIKSATETLEANGTAR